MTLSNHDQATIRDYLLGKLTEEEQEKIEERLMVEEDLFEELEISRAERVEEYRAGELDQGEREWFERFLATPEGRRSHAFAVAVDCMERNQQTPALSLFERLAQFFRNPQWATATVAMATLVIVVSVVWNLSRQPSKAIAITLNNSTVRRSVDAAQYPTVQVPPDTDQVKVTLTLPQPVTPDVDYQVELDNRRTTKLLELSTHDETSVSVVIPVEDIPPGLYALRITEIKKDGTKQQIPGDYFFTRL